ncbi:PAS domain-containing protein [Sphingomonas yunnanensis]|uniref:sensor histidine kinase n=1 Tax=Sphingomonas yunnanensis TaxID=310400 RepID=UPI001CA76940|nr:PAS domain-containing protein [Sphingomonas yunnanensis]MBY9063139.1 PAS domain-containing protein [Sphingomonas yunnanensis]
MGERDVGAAHAGAIQLGAAGSAARGWRVNEARRRATIDSLNLASLRRSAALRQITDFAAQLCGAPVALITLIEEADQSFLASTGTDLEGTRRSESFCAHTMWEEDVTVFPDLTADERFLGNPLLREPGFRFYAGAPLVADDGVPLGALCVLDMTPRPEGLTALQRDGLRVLASNVMARLRGSRDDAAWREAAGEARRAAAESETRFRTLADTMPQMVWSTLPDGYHDYYNARWYEFTGMPEGSTDGEEWNGVFHPDDQARAWAVWRRSLETGEAYQIEYRLRHVDGTYRWVLGRALPIRDRRGAITRWFGTCTDIHEQKLALEEREVVSQELSHRIKNIFSVISGLIHFAARANPELATVANDLRHRIIALGRAHDFVRPHSNESRPHLAQDSLHGLLAELFAPYQRLDGDRVVIGGDDVAVDDRAATPLALLFHELATNASKYGALSVARGRVDLAVTRGAETVRLDWRERGGPALDAPPPIDGFGSQLIELSAVRQLGGTVTRTWHPDGLELAVTVPLPAFSRAAAT